MLQQAEIYYKWAKDIVSFSTGNAVNSDERVVEAWVRNPYYQALCGMEHFPWQFPCEPSDLGHFRKRIGKSGVEKIFQASVWLHGKQESTNFAKFLTISQTLHHRLQPSPK